MTDALHLLGAIYRADKDAGDVFARSYALDVGGEAMRTLRGEVAKALPGELDRMVRVLGRSLGRDYVAKAQRGEDLAFDADMMRAFAEIGDLVRVGKAITLDTITIDGNQIQVYRDKRGRFARKTGQVGEGKREDYDTQVVQRFRSAPADRRSVRGLPAKERRTIVREEIDPKGQFLESGAPGMPLQLKTNYAGGSLDEKLERNVLVGLESQNTLNELTDILESGSDPFLGEKDSERNDVAEKLVVRIAAEPANGGKARYGTARWDRKYQTFTMPKGMERGWRITDYDVESDDGALSQRLGEMAGGTMVEGSPLTIPISANKLAQAAGTNVRNNEGMQQTRGSMAVNAANAAAGLLGGIGAKGAEENLRTIARGMQSVDTNDSLRGSMTRAAYRLRGVDSPVVSQEIKAAAGRTGRGQFEESREKYYQSTLSPDQYEGLDEALDMGNQRDNVTATLWARHQKRSGNAGMGALGDMDNRANYNALAQRIASNIGRGIPSEGVLIDRRGNVVAQSMGISHDGFVPFGAGALGKMSGGQYVRTRQLGGFTGEDIRTLLVGNGRAAQVVSNSGVYELELDPSMRGTKRYNDIALQMVDTYDRILDEIAAGGHYAVDLTPQAKKNIDNALKGVNPGDTEKYQAKRRAAMETEYNKMGELTDAERSKIARDNTERLLSEYHSRKYGAAAEKTARDDSSEGAQRFLASSLARLEDEASQQKSRVLKLNSEGYALALKTLQQYYPYMIRTARYRSNGEFAAEAGATEDIYNEQLKSSNTSAASDRWATKPWQVRPEAPERKNEELERAAARSGRLATERAKNRSDLRVTPGKVVQANVPSQPGQSGQAQQGRPSAVFGNRTGEMERAIKDFANAVQVRDIADASDTPLNVSTIANRGTDDKIVRAAIAAMSNPSTSSGLLSLLTSDSDDAARITAALMQPRAYEAIMNDPEPDNRPRDTTVEGLQAVGKKIVTLAALKRNANAPRISSTADLAEVPETDGPVMMDDSTIPPTEFGRAVEANPVFKNALAAFEGVTSPSGGEAQAFNAASPYKEVANLRATVKAAIEQYSDTDALRIADNDRDRASALGNQGIMSAQDTAKAVKLVEAYGDGVLTDNDAAAQMQKQLALGHGLWLQGQVMDMASNPEDAYSGKARGLVGKSDHQAQEWLAESLEALALL